jgi:hypothetical protein
LRQIGMRRVHVADYSDRAALLTAAKKTASARGLKK